MQEDDEGVRNVVHDAGPYASSCGYCRRAGETSWAHGMFGQRITPQSYQDLIDQGWRRSGTFLYKPLMQKSCCDLYTIRLDATAFQPTSTQRKLLRKWDNYLAGTSHAAASPAAAATPKASSPSAGAQQAQLQPEAAGGTPKFVTKPGSETRDVQPGRALPQIPGPDPIAGLVVTLLLTAFKRCIDNGTLPQLDPLPAPAVSAASAKVRKQLGDDVLYSSSLAFQATQSYKRSGKDCPGADSVAALLSQSFNEVVGGGGANAALPPSAAPVRLSCRAEKGFLNLVSVDGGGGGGGAPAGPVSAEQQPVGARRARHRDCHVHVRGGSGSRDGRMHDRPAAASSELGEDACRVAEARRGPEAGAAAAMETQGARDNGGGGTEAPAPAQQRQRGGHEFEVRMVPAQYDQESFELYRRYQVQQHGDKAEDVTPASYTRFLVQSPLVAQPRQAGSSDDPETGYGSFHQQYILDGKLIAVGVVDVLPRCLSSVYFFWDPALPSLSLGKLSALKELQWVQHHVQSQQQQQQQQQSQQQQQQQQRPVSLRYYYMGFYIHTCHKMRYKADFHPSDLLCPVTKVWVRMSPAVIKALEAQRHVKLAALPGVEQFPNLAFDGSEPKQQQQQQQQQVSPVQAQRVQQQQQQPGSRLMQEVVVMFSDGLQKLAMRWQELDGLRIFSEASSRRLKKQLEAWIGVVGPAATGLVYEI